MHLRPLWGLEPLTLALPPCGTRAALRLPLREGRGNRVCRTQRVCEPVTFRRTEPRLRRLPSLRRRGWGRFETIAVSPAPAGRWLQTGRAIAPRLRPPARPKSVAAPARPFFGGRVYPGDPSRSRSAFSQGRM